ncbi:sodium/glutamate symporter [Sinorhizobium terangae]|uniref:Sodium/glutamate symporter n=1 Tax=Sinorhizobium terangae TaxID=110322 RepID=A0A6N7LDD6_SINTE|nr:sodium/glutamate symporter [Sinorhizobium terangae]MBB4186249.1 ESS family glutamate:Na+ symporter [Sinorhizobium terangae]MQX15867.1 sodium/glutamate symporter [Sinorhizobium terangae]WFU51099.1 sodium/glutamate symporter [Sinorhizobium terangae]
MPVVQVPAFLTFTLSILVFFIGSRLNRSVPALSHWNIPEAVTGGLISAFVTLMAYAFFGTEIRFALGARDLLLLYFFTGVGLNARVSDLIAGGRPFLVLLALTLVFLVIQSVVAVGGTALLGLPAGFSILLGSVSLVGGHGTTIAWAPTISSRFGLANAMEVGIASATLGLVIASILGGPIARHLISRNALHGKMDEELIVGVSNEQADRHADEVSYQSVLQTLLVMNIAVIGGFLLHELVVELGIKLPLFVICMFFAILLTNTVPLVAPRLPWPTRTRPLSLISDLSLNIFLAMSLMSLQLWTLRGLGLSILVVLALQTVTAVAYILFVVFPAMGRSYNAAVISAGFTGISLGATPTAIANMAAVTKTHGAAPIAFIILPLVSAFFIDIANAGIITFMVR